MPISSGVELWMDAQQYGQLESGEKKAVAEAIEMYEKAVAAADETYEIAVAEAKKVLTNALADITAGRFGSTT